MEVLVSRDGHWRLEPRRDGLAVLWRADTSRGAWTLLLADVQMDQVVAFLASHGVDPDDLVAG